MVGAETVTRPTHRLDQAGCFTQRFSQSFDVDIDRTLLNKDMVTQIGRAHV